MAVMVVTDSSARLPEELLATNGIRVVPLHILVDGIDLRDLRQRELRAHRGGCRGQCCSRQR